jgi:large subunit ribosomal protein L4
VTLDGGVFGAEIKAHLVHEAVRAEQNALRAGTRAVKSRGLVAGGRSKPWRQKGTGRARAGSTRAPHWTGGGVAFAPRTSFGGKVNRKERKAALRAALSAHADEGTFGVLADDSLDAPSTKTAAALLDTWGKRTPLVVVAQEEQDAITKSFRNLDGVVVVTPGELEVSALVWARSVLVSEGALEAVQGRAQG